ncbi:MAG: TIGR03862 family flavoprotein [Flavobacteriales bacterium]
MNKNKTFDVVLFGGGPANLMAASFLLNKGLRVGLFEQNAQIGKKFLIAGKSGLNLSMDFSLDEFLQNYYGDQQFLRPFLNDFTPVNQRQFFKEILEVDTYVGSAGKVFPKENAVTVLKKWVKYLKHEGLEIYSHHKWLEGQGCEHIVLDIKANEKIKLNATYSVFGLGGNSWSSSGSNGNWINAMQTNGVKIQSFQPSNSGYKTNLDAFVFEKWNGQFIKNCTITVNQNTFTGEIRIGGSTLEGSPIYHSNYLVRKALENNESVTLFIDFKPQMSLSDLKERWNSKQSVSKKCTRLKINKVFPVFFRSLNTRIEPWQCIKQFPIEVNNFGELDAAISTIGGVKQEMIHADLSLKYNQNWFVNGEMVDWDAPTGGYLLSACFAMGHSIANTILN